MKCLDCGFEYTQKELKIGDSVFFLPFSCPKCDEAVREKLAKEAENECIKEENERILRWIANANFPPIYANMRNYEPMTEAQAMEWDYATPLIFIGGTGSGKTKKACWLAIVGIWKYKKTARYTIHSGLVSRIKASWSSKVETEDSVINDFINADILIIDELDKQEYTEYLFRVLDGRYGANRPTILLSNSTIEEVRRILGDALNSRLRGQGVKARSFGSKDFRLKNEG